MISARRPKQISMRRRSPAFPSFITCSEWNIRLWLNQNIVIIRLKYPAHSSKLFPVLNWWFQKQEQKNEKKSRKLGNKDLLDRHCYRHRIYSAMIAARFTVPTTQPAVPMREIKHCVLTRCIFILYIFVVFGWPFFPFDIVLVSICVHSARLR